MLPKYELRGGHTASDDPLPMSRAPSSDASRRYGTSLVGVAINSSVDNFTKTVAMHKAPRHLNGKLRLVELQLTPCDVRDACQWSPQVMFSVICSNHYLGSVCSALEASDPERDSAGPWPRDGRR